MLKIQHKVKNVWEPIIKNDGIVKNAYEPIIKTDGIVKNVWEPIIKNDGIVKNAYEPIIKTDGIVNTNFYCCRLVYISKKTAIYYSIYFSFIVKTANT
jgi:hypothetical protein